MPLADPSIRPGHFRPSFSRPSRTAIAAAALMLPLVGAWAQTGTGTGTGTSTDTAASCALANLPATSQTGSLTTGASGDTALATTPYFASTVLVHNKTPWTDAANFPGYRIPAFAVANNGDLIAAYDARDASGSDLPANVAPVVRISTDKGATWSAQRVVQSDFAPYGFGDPSLLVDRTTGRVFLFFTTAKYAGYASSGTGNDLNATTHLSYSYSDDNGRTWTYRDISSVKPSTWAGSFFTSGAGMQMKTSVNCAGRLINQVVARVNGQPVAASVYSDDHGETWTLGEPALQNVADENKVAELSDGRLMMNSRAANYAHDKRLVAYSSDGGISFTPYQSAANLPDPGNNAHILRVHPDAPAGSADAKMLLFTNTAMPNERSHMTLRLSCDDGATWPVSKLLDADTSYGYSVIQKLADGTFGVVWEQPDARIGFARFNAAWIGSCAAASAAPEPTLSTALAPTDTAAAKAPVQPTLKGFASAPAEGEVLLRGTGQAGDEVTVTLTPEGSTVPMVRVVPVAANGGWSARPLLKAGRYSIALQSRHGGAALSTVARDAFNVAAKASATAAAAR